MLFNLANLNSAIFSASSAFLERLLGVLYGETESEAISAFIYFDNGRFSH
jgi:hypothetical protein